MSKNCLQIAVNAINAMASVEGWSIFDIDGLGVHFEIQKEDDSDTFTGDIHAMQHVQTLADAGSHLHKRALEIHQETARKSKVEIPLPEGMLHSTVTQMSPCHWTARVRMSSVCHGDGGDLFISRHSRDELALDAWRSVVPAEIELKLRDAEEPKRGPDIDTDNVTRFEVIDEGGRAHVRYGVKIELSVQDQGRTLKVFVKSRN